MKKLNKAIGNLGEDVSINYLLGRNFKIITRNFRCRLGEIDIIANKKGILHFIEVKSRFSTIYGLPMEAVTYSKRKKLKTLAEYYIIKNHYSNINCCFDVLEVFFEYDSKNYKINYLEDAFR